MRKLAQIQAFGGGGIYNVSLKSTNWGTLTTAAAWKSKIESYGTTDVVISNFFLKADGTVRFYFTSTNNAYLILNNYSVTNIYRVTAGFVYWTFTGNNINDIPQNSYSLTNDRPLVLDLKGNPLTGSVFIPVSCRTFNAYETSTITSVNHFNWGNSLVELVIFSNQISVFDPVNPLPSTFRILRLGGNKLTYFAPTLALPNITELYLNNNLITTTGWTASESWATSMPTTTNCRINLSGNTNSASGTTFASILLAKGYTLIY